jgi:DNA modification methylase
MHRCLDPVWKELWRIMADGAIACINIGDATRTVGTDFSLFANHARILSQLTKTGFTPLPSILWRKPTNSPTKFMGSGMLPAGAYVTLEHEYILVVRKGSRRKFTTDREKRVRRESAIFWEERNEWYSDVWLNVIGTRQGMNAGTQRLRSAAFPFEIPFRLINMFSVKGDWVIDPFAGTGTTLKAAAALGRNCRGFDLDRSLLEAAFGENDALPGRANAMAAGRLRRHREFVAAFEDNRRPLKHFNRPYQVPVVTSQETDLFFNPLLSTEMLSDDVLEVNYIADPDAVTTVDMEQVRAELSADHQSQLKLFKA